MNRYLLRFLAPCVLASIAVAAGGCVGKPGGEDVGTTESAISDGEKTAYEYFVGKGLKDFQAAGIVGNLEQESDVDPTVYQYGGGPGRGIAQWSAGGRWDSDYHDNVVWYAGTKGDSPWSLTLQLDFIWYELDLGYYGLSELRASTNVSDATSAFASHFEICGECDESNRVAYAEAVLSAYGGGGGGGGDSCSEGDGYCTATSQCDGHHWVPRSSDPAACTSGPGATPSDYCSEGDGYCTSTSQCDDHHWVPRSSDPSACTSGPGATPSDYCSEGDGYCTSTSQCDDHHWVPRSSDPASCTSGPGATSSDYCSEGDGYCTSTSQCDDHHWVPRSSDPAACTSGPGA